MRRLASFSWIPVAALALSACAGDDALAPGAGFDLEGGDPLAAVLPDLAPEPGTAGTERYVPVLERMFVRSLRAVRERAGEEAAGRLAAEARGLHRSVLAAREAGDGPAATEALQKLEAFEARVALRVFGPVLVRHVHADAAGRLEALVARIGAAADAGRDVTRARAGARLAHRDLAAAREAAGSGRPGVALVLAAHALDLVIRIAAIVG